MGAGVAAEAMVVGVVLEGSAEAAQAAAGLGEIGRSASVASRSRVVSG